jgi:hypothetical protein
MACWCRAPTLLRASPLPRPGGLRHRPQDEEAGETPGHQPRHRRRMTPQTAPPRAPRSLLLPLLLLLVAVLVAPLAWASPARAVSSTGHGVGYLWRGDGVSYLGTYQLADGRRAFCLEAGKSSPIGNEYATATGPDVVGISSADHARLPYIARTWGGTDDRDAGPPACRLGWRMPSITAEVEHMTRPAGSSGPTPITFARSSR